MKITGIKKITRLAGLGIICLSLVAVGWTGWFISNTLDDIASPDIFDSSVTISVPSLDTGLLQTIQIRLSKKTSASDSSVNRLRNPFLTAPPTPPPPADQP